MKWIKHDTDANQDAKLQNVLLDYGLEGYGLFWYCIELIAGKVDKDNITFDLEHDARIIARNTGSTPQKVEEMMRYFVTQGLFEDTAGVITCLKLSRRLDKSMTSNPEMRTIIEKLRNHDGVMTQSEKVMQDKIRLDKTREEENKDFAQKENCAVLIEQGFNIFYSAGLVKKSKKSALDKFKLLAKNMKADPIELGELLKTDIQSRIANQQFGIDKLHPATYLNQQRWEDDNEKDINGLNAAGRKLGAAERVAQRNAQRYGTPSSGLGMGENGGDLRGAVDQGEWRGAIIDVEVSSEQTNNAGDQDWDC